jgi:cell division protein FtsB
MFQRPRSWESVYRPTTSGISARQGAFKGDMRTLSEIKQDLDRLTDRRADVLHQLSDGHNAELTKEHKKLDEQIAQLWDEQRIVRASIRFGDRDLIIQRARHEERLSRAA